MAAPSGTTWGSAVGDYGRIGISTSSTLTDTSKTVTVQVWFWSKYSVSDSNNTLYLTIGKNVASATDNRGSCSIVTSVDSGSGWSTSNQVKIYETTNTYNRGYSGTGSGTYYVKAELSNIDRVGGSMSVSASFGVEFVNKSDITYDANGGSGAPSGQSVYKGNSLTLSSTIPTREGFTFLGWATSATAATAAYSPGGSYTFAQSTKLYAVWERLSYTVTYDANGGSGAPSNQTKYYGVALTLSTATPTRSGYTFLGWAKSSVATSAEYSSGQSYTGNAALTLYAVWAKVYKKPSIYNVRTSRCDKNLEENVNGEYAKVNFDWITQSEVTSIVVHLAYIQENGEPYELDVNKTASGTSGTIEQMIFAPLLFPPLYAGAAVTATITVSDAGGSTSATATCSFNALAMDFHAGEIECDGVAFGKAADLGKDDSLGGAGVVEFAFDGKFNEPVYGKALGMDRLPAIPENANFDDYIEPGCYAVYSNAIAETVSNIPVNRAGRLEVWSATGEGVRLEQWSYLRQRYIPYNRSNAVWERELTRGENNVWNYYEWWRSSLTPAASEKVYAKAAITASMSVNVTLGVVNVYTQVPLPNVAVETSERLYIDNNSVKIGSDISYVKVSGQLSVMCKSVAGKRHARIQKVSGSTTTSYAWDCITAVTADETDTILNFSPVIIPVKAGDIIKIVYYTPDANDLCYSGNVTNGWKTYLTVEEI